LPVSVQVIAWSDPSLTEMVTHLTSSHLT